MRINLQDIPELPSDPHPFFLLPRQRLSVGGREVPYREAGSGKAVLLLHGLWARAYTFRSLVPLLEEGHRLILPELTTLSGENPLPERLAELIPGIIQSLELRSPLVVAHAESGLAAMILALERPESVSALVTLGMPVEVSSMTRLRGWFLRKRRLNERWAQKGYARPQQTALQMLDYADPAVVSRQEIRHLARMWSTLPAARSTSRILAQTYSRVFYQGTMERLDRHLTANNTFPVPLKLIYGELDGRAPVQHGEHLNRLIHGSELMVAEGCSGATQVERPAWTAKVIRSAAGP